MFLNFFKVAIRGLRKHKGYALINVLGLAVGLASFFLIGLWVRDELGFDRFHANKDRIFRILNRLDDGRFIPSPTYALAPALKELYPEVEDYARIWPWGSPLVKVGDKRFDTARTVLTDPGFFRMFTFPFARGTADTALADRGAVVLTEAAAGRYFGAEDPLGKVVRLEDYDADLTVTGVVKDVPSNSHIQFDLVARVELLGEDRLARWNEWMGPAYLLLRPGASAPEFSAKIADIYRLHADPDADYVPVLQPLTRVHLHEDGRPGGVKKVRLFSLIAFFILVMACVNFMNLATARSTRRAREVGIRKTAGAPRSSLIGQFLGEAVITAFISLVLALALLEAALPQFNLLTGKNLSLASKADLGLLLTLPLVTLVAGLLAGSYPAFFLSSFQAARTVKNQAGPGRRGAGVRRALILFQFAISAGLITCTFIVSRQLRYIQTMDLGLNRDHVVVLFNYPRLTGGYDSFKTGLENGSGILSVTSAAQGPTWVGTGIGMDWEGNPDDRDLPVGYTVVDYDFFRTFDMDIVRGRGFSKRFPADEAEACVINQSAAAKLGVDDPVGMTVSLNHPAWPEPFRRARIIGVVKDFNSRTLHRPIQPFVFRMYKPWCQYIFIKVDGTRIPDALERIRSAFSAAAPDYPFRYVFYDEAFNDQYASERQLGTLFGIFGLLSILISCLGLFGLAAFSAEQRTKEIGIRKVLGASVTGLVALTARDNLKWVAAAHLVAWPVAWLVMRGWLDDFAYRTRIGPPVFVLSAVLTVMVALLTVIYQAVKAAFTDPVTSLRHE
jgi:putative ABC transport system permease protein